MAIKINSMWCFLRFSLSVSFISCLPCLLSFHQSYFLLFCEKTVINFGQGVMRNFAHFSVMITQKHNGWQVCAALLNTKERILSFKSKHLLKWARGIKGKDKIIVASPKVCLHCHASVALISQEPYFLYQRERL